MPKHYLLYSTCSTEAEAAAIARALVEQKLAACANILPGMRSVYRWEGKLEEAQEVVLIAKTTGAALQAAIDTIKQLHSYECPCITALPITTGHPDYLRWISENVG